MVEGNLQNTAGRKARCGVWLQIYNLYNDGLFVISLIPRPACNNEKLGWACGRGYNFELEC